MHKLPYVRAWSRACQLATDHFDPISACSDRTIRLHLQTLLLSIPCNLAAGLESEPAPSTTTALDESRCACARLNTVLYIARELNVIDRHAVSALLRQSLELTDLITALAQQRPRAGTSQPTRQNAGKATIFNE